MLKRVIPLLILAVVLTTAPAAMANQVCGPAPEGGGFERPDTAANETRIALLEPKPVSDAHR